MAVISGLKGKFYRRRFQCEPMEIFRLNMSVCSLDFVPSLDVALKVVIEPSFVVKMLLFVFICCSCRFLIDDGGEGWNAFVVCCRI